MAEAQCCCTHSKKSRRNGGGQEEIDCFKCRIIRNCCCAQDCPRGANPKNFITIAYCFSLCEKGR